MWLQTKHQVFFTAVQLFVYTNLQYLLYNNIILSYFVVYTLLVSHHFQNWEEGRELPAGSQQGESSQCLTGACISETSLGCILYM